MTKNWSWIIFALVSFAFAFFIVAAEPWNSDLFYVEAIYRDITRAIALDGWHFSAATFFFPDWPLYFFLRFTLHQMNLSLVIYLFLMFSLNQFAVVLFSAENRVKTLTLFLLTFFTVFPHEWWFAFFPADHGSQWLIGLLVGWFFLKEQKFSAPFIFSFSIISGLLLASDLFFGVTILLPIALIGLADFWRKFDRPKLLKQCATGVISIGFAWFAHVLIMKWFHQEPGKIVMVQTGQSLGTVFSHFFKYVRGLKFGLIAIAIAFYQLGKEAKHSRVAQFFVISIILTTGFVLLGGLWIDSANVRYLSVIAFAVSFYFSRYLITIEKNRMAFYPILFAIVFFTGQRIFDMTMDTKQNPFSEVYPPTVECLDRHAGELGSTVGLSDYWNAKYSEFISRKGLRLIPIQDNFTQLSWIDNAHWYDQIGPARYLILDTPRNDELGRAALLRFGPAKNHFICGNNEIRIYDHDLNYLR